MSAPPKTTDKAICEAARALLEKDGADAVSMQAIADAVGIRAPSLYKRFQSKSDILSAAGSDALNELAETLAGLVDAKEPYDSLERMAHAYRKFARKNPRLYELLFSASLTPRDDLLAARQAAAQHLLTILHTAMTPNDASPAAWLLISYLHGFLSMEIAKAFRFGGSSNRIFQSGLTKVLNCLLELKKNPTSPI